jgi:hypothetical protein
MPPPPVPAAFGLAPAVATQLEQAFLAAAAAPEAGLLLDLQGRPPVPAAFVRWLLLQAAPAFDATLTRVALWHATIDGALQLAGTTLRLTPAFVNCTATAIDLTDATVPGLEAIGGTLAAVRADRLDANGSVLLRGARADATYHHVLPADAQADIVIAGGLLLCGAKIRGNLDLRGAKLGRIARLDDVALEADGLHVEGNTLLGDGFGAWGEVRLNGSTIERDLDLSAALLVNLRGRTLAAAGATVKGSVYLRRDRAGKAFESHGLLRLEGATIEGSLDASGGIFTACAFARPDWRREGTPAHDNVFEMRAIDANGINVGAHVRLDDGFVAHGGVWLLLARIGGEFSLTGGRFDFPGEEALLADAATIAGATFLVGCETNGLLRFVQARLLQGCVCRGLRLSVRGVWQGWSILGAPVESELGRNLCGLAAGSAELGGSFIWREVVRDPAPEPPSAAEPRRLWLAAPGASVVELDDDRASWELLDRIDVRDCRYQRITTLGSDTFWRALRLDREYAPWNEDVPDRVFSRRRWRLDFGVLRRTWRGEQHSAQPGTLGAEVRKFAPGPYLQFARVLQGAGYVGGAEEVLLRLERNRTRYGGGTTRKILVRWALDLALRYGQRPFRPLWFLVVWALISGTLLKWVHDSHGIVPIGKDKVRFDWFFYALDTLVPVFDFGQKKSFAVEPLASWGGALVLFNALCGYAALAFLAAGLSGLVRTGKDGG